MKIYLHPNYTTDIPPEVSCDYFCQTKCKLNKTKPIIFLKEAHDIVNVLHQHNCCKQFRKMLHLYTQYLCWYDFLIWPLASSVFLLQNHHHHHPAKRIIHTSECIILVANSDIALIHQNAAGASGRHESAFDLNFWLFFFLNLHRCMTCTSVRLTCYGGRH